MKKQLLTGIVALGMAFSAQAVLINGGIGFTGTYTPNDSDLSAATSIVINSAEVETVSGDFATAGIVVDQAATVASPITVGALGPQPIPAGPIWSIAGFQMTLSSWNQILDFPTSVTLTGLGVITGPGIYEATTGDFTLTFSRSGEATFTFASTSSSIRVPDGGATVALLGMALVGTAFLRRRFEA